MQSERISLPPSIRMEALVHYGHRCIYCGVTSRESQLEVDHVIPVAKGGTNEIGNLVVACKPCNRGKGKRMLLDVTEGDIGVYVRSPAAKPITVPEAAWDASRKCDDLVAAWLPRFRRHWSSVNVLPETLDIHSVGEEFQFSPTFICRGRESCDIGAEVRVLLVGWCEIGRYTPEDQIQIRNAVISGYEVPTMIITGPPEFFFAVLVNERHKGVPRGRIIDAMLQPTEEWDGDGWYPDECKDFQDLRTHVPPSQLTERTWDSTRECFSGVYFSCYSWEDSDVI